MLILSFILALLIAIDLRIAQLSAFETGIRPVPFEEDADEDGDESDKEAEEDGGEEDDEDAAVAATVSNRFMLVAMVVLALPITILFPTFSSIVVEDDGPPSCERMCV